MVSLLKTWYGDKATKENDFAYSYVPKVDDGGRILAQHDRQYVPGQGQGMLPVGQNPACSLPNTNKVRKALSNLDWMVHVNIFDNETASFGTGREWTPRRSKPRSSCFRLARSVEGGSIANSGRWLQWRYRAVEPPGDALAEGDIIYRLMVKLKELYKKEGGSFPIPSSTWHGTTRTRKACTIRTRSPRHVTAISSKDVTLKDPGRQVLSRRGIWSRLRLPTGRRKDVVRKLVFGESLHQAGNLIARGGKEDPTGLGLFPEWGWAGR